MKTVAELGKLAKAAAATVNSAPAALKNKALTAVAETLRAECEFILAANERDIAAAQENGIAPTMVDRLRLTKARIDAMADAVMELVAMEDPVGTVDYGVVRPNGLMIEKTRVPLGVLGIIFESRPNVSVDAATLCLKAGNTVILRGGKEAIHSNMALVDCMRRAVAKAGLPEDCIALVEDTSRASAKELMQLSDSLDALIPRGGAGLIRAVMQDAKVPVIQTGVGNCHIYVDESADLQMAVDIVNNAKVSRPSVCNAAESLLVHQAVASEFLPMMKAKLDEANVILHGCERTYAVLGDCVIPATEEDYAKEYLDYELSVKVVDSVEEAIEHIAAYSTGHSEAIITNDLNHSKLFTSRVDSAAVYVNASTRFTDGGEFGFGAEIGISTQKLHARGPMGLKELTSIKYIIHGDGQIR